MVDLANLIVSHEDWLMRRVLSYARERGYTRYASTLEGTWRMAVRGVSASLLAAIARPGTPQELGPDEDYSRDPTAIFGVVEARKHRELGVDIALFLGLLKYYRRSYLDLVQQAGFGPDYEDDCRRFIDRCFDRLEIALCREWVDTPHEAPYTVELQPGTRVMNDSKALCVFESLPNPVILLDEEGRIDHINLAAAELIVDMAAPYPSNLALGTMDWDGPPRQGGAVAAIQGAVSDRIEELFPWLTEYLRVFLSGDAPRCSLELKAREEGEDRDFDVRFSRIHDVCGRNTGTVVILNDVTEHKRTQEALSEERNFVSTVFDTVAALVMVLNTHGRVLRWNRACERLTGYTGEEIIGRRAWELLVVPDERAQVQAAFDEFLHKGFSNEHESLIRTKGGDLRRIAWSNTAVLDGNDGTVKFLISTGIDITESRDAEEERKVTIELLHLLNSTGDSQELMHSLVAFFKSWARCDAVGIRLRDGADFPYFATQGFSDAFVAAEMSLYAPGEHGEPTQECELQGLCGKVLTGVHDASVPCFTAKGSFWTGSTTELLAGFTDFPGRLRGRCMAEGYESVALIPLRFEGKTYGLLQLNDRHRGVFTPKRVACLERLADKMAIALAKGRAEEERLQLVKAVEQADESFVLLDRKGRIQYVNPVFERLTGQLREEVVGCHCSVLKSSQHDEAFYEEIWKTVTSGSVWKGRIVNETKAGTPYETESTITPVQDAFGNVNNYVIIKRDISREARLERQLRQAQKMEAIGTLAGGIAHDFNNILSPIIGYAEMALIDLSGDPPGPPTDLAPLRRDLEQILKAANRARELVKQILAFSRQGEEERGPVQVSSVIKEVLRLLRASLPATISIQHVIEPSARESVVLADPVQVHQVLVNLCANAGHAMRKMGGVLEVVLSTIDLDSALASGYANLEPGPYLQIAVSDTGHGMDESVRNRIFDPYFTTKGPGEGTGMGLSVVYGIIKGYGGAIAVESALGKGSTFTILLPRVERAVSAVEREASVRLQRGKGRVLVVDDEEAIREMLRNALERSGYEVVCGTNSIDVLELFRAQPDRFDLVITDLTMPYMTGIELARELLLIRSELPIILCTGFSEAVTEESARRIGIKGFLSKPVSLRQVTETIERLMGG